MDSEYDVFRKSIDLKRKLLARSNESKENFVNQNPSIKMFDAIDTTQSDKALDLQNNHTSVMECDSDSLNSEANLNKYIKLLNQNSKKYLDHVYGVYKKQNTLMIGDSPLYLEINQARVNEASYPLTKGLLELLFKKQPNTKVVSQADLRNYRLILESSNAHKKHFNKDESVRRHKSHKYKHLIAPMFENQLDTSEKKHILKFIVNPESEGPQGMKKIGENKERNSPMISKNQFDNKQCHNRRYNLKCKKDSDEKDVSLTDSSSTIQTDEESDESDEETDQSAKNQLKRSAKRNSNLTFDPESEFPRELKKICWSKRQNSATITKQFNKKYGNGFKYEIDSDDEGVDSIDSNAIETDEESEFDDDSDYKNAIVNYEKIDVKTINYKTWDDPNELVDRLRYLIKRQSQNNCTCHEYEIRLILRELRKEGYIY